MSGLSKLKVHKNPFQTILIGFAGLIIIGTILLELPISSMSRQSVSLLNALFTSTSATCVTGLVVYDTATHWSLFGKIVILTLIQIGGIGIITINILVMIITGKRIGIFQRMTMQDAVSAPQIGGIVKFTKFLIKGTVIIETIGAILLYPFFEKEFGGLTGIGYSIFHSVSAFCNAGFDLMGTQEKFSSFSNYSGNIYVNVVICLLIILGGLGYLTWKDIIDKKLNFRRMNLQTKIILFTTMILIVIPFVYFVLFEFNSFPIKERILLSLFQSITPRTAGFNTTQYSQMSESGLFITIILMLIGGAPGSTAGGIKVTTAFVLFTASMNYLRNDDDVSMFKRRIDSDTIINAFTLLMVYVGLLIIGSIILSSAEHLPIIKTMFECASALGTVGLTTGITSYLSNISKVILICFMFFGRVGGVTIAYALFGRSLRKKSRMPVEKVTVG